MALKELRVRAPTAALVQRFVREASKVAGSLSHPNIVMVHEFFEHDGLPYIAMELVDGGSLRSHVGKTRAPSSCWG